MKAIVLDEYGDSSKLAPREVSEPKPGPGEIKVRVAAASLNPIDWKLRSGVAKAFMPLQFPAVLGRDVSGEVVELGKGVTEFKVTDPVIGLVQHGYAEFVTAPASHFAKVPPELDVKDAAGIPLAGLTGVQLVEETAGVKPGQTVLVVGAVGSVGRFAAYAARALGAKVIAGVKKSQLEKAQSLDVDLVIAVDDQEAVASMPMVDVIADTVGGPQLEALTQKVKDGGFIATTAGAPKGDPSRRVVGKGMLTHPDGKRLGELAAAMAQGALELPIVMRFSLDEAASAHQFAERGAGGKVLLTT